MTTPTLTCVEGNIRNRTWEPRDRDQLTGPQGREPNVVRRNAAKPGPAEIRGGWHEPEREHVGD